MEWVVPGLVPAGMLTVLAGQQGLGKSLLYCAWAATLAETERSSLLVNAEDSPTHSTKPRLEALRAKDEHIIHTKVRPVFGNGSTEQWCFNIGQWIVASRADLLVLDPLAAFIDSRADVYRDHHVRALLEPLAFLAEATQCAIVYVKHLTKSGATEPLDRITDSQAFTAAARSVVLMTREGEYGSTMRLVTHAKSNVSELAPIQRWEVVPTLLPAVDGLPEVKTARIEYRNIAEGVSAFDVLQAPPSSEEKTKLEQAEEMIRAALAFGDVPSRDLDAEAEAMGISRRTLEIARSNLGVRAVKKGRTWFVYLSQSKTAEGKTAEEGLRSSNPHGYEENEGRPQYTDVCGVPSEGVSQSPPAQGSLDWIGTASWAELQKGLTDTGTSDTVET